MRVLASLFTLLALVVLGLLIWSPQFDLDLGDPYSVHVADRNLSLRMWPTPRESGAPDTYTGPLWCALVMAGAVAGFLWLCGTRSAPEST